MTEPSSPQRIPLVPKLILGFILGLLLTLGIFSCVELNREPPEFEFFPVPPPEVSTDSGGVTPAVVVTNSEAVTPAE